MLTALAPFDADTILPIADARTQLRLTADDSFHDAAIGLVRSDAIAWLEDYTGLSLQERQFLWTEESFTDRMRLPRVPVTAIDDISYYDDDGLDTALDEADWYFGNNSISSAAGTSWPTSNGLPGGVRITFTAGYTLPADIPFNVMAAVRLAMTAFFENRSNPDLKGAMQVADQNRMMVA